mgnify:CR=1 FL=1
MVKLIIRCACLLCGSTLGACLDVLNAHSFLNPKRRNLANKAISVIHRQVHWSAVFGFY